MRLGVIGLGVVSLVLSLFGLLTLFSNLWEKVSFSVIPLPWIFISTIILQICVFIISLALIYLGYKK